MGSGEGYPAGGAGGRMTAAQMLLALTDSATLATGALLYGDGDSTPATLAAGTNGHVLTLAGGVPTWAATGLPGSYAVGDILYASGPSTLAKLAAVASGSVLASAGVTTAPAWQSSIALLGTIASKQAAAAGISLDHNSATGNFTFRLSPANLTANRRATFPDADFTVAGLSIAQTFSADQTFSATTSVGGKVRSGAVLSYGALSLNNAIGTIGSICGMFGAGPGDDNLYLNAPVSQSVQLRVNNVQLLAAQAGGISIPLTTASTSTTTGALTVAGGVGVVGALWADSFRLDTNKLLIGGGVEMLKYNGTSVVIGESAANRGASIPCTTASTSTTTGGLTVAGGVGIAGDATARILRVAGSSGGFPWELQASGGADEFYLRSNTAAAIRLTVKGNGDASLSSTTPSTSPTTGALLVGGGIGAGGAFNNAQGTITAAAAVLSSTSTWNNGAITFTGWQLNVTDTASATGSLFLDLQVGGSSRFAVNKRGHLVLNNSTLTATSTVIDITQTFNSPGNFLSLFRAAVTFTAGSTGSYIFDLQCGVASFQYQFNGLLTYSGTTNGTNLPMDVLRVTGRSSGTVVAGFGVRENLQLEDASDNPQPVADRVAEWVDPATATRKGRVRFNVIDTATREGLRIEASGTAPMIGFLGANAVARATMAAPTGTTTRTTFDTATVTTAQLAERVKALIDDLRAYGLHG